MDPIQSTPSAEDLQANNYKMAIMDTGTAQMGLPAPVLKRLQQAWT